MIGISTFVPAAMVDLCWLKGEPQRTTFTAENGSKRQFCKTCGSSLTCQSASSDDSLEIALAILDSSHSFEDKHPQPDAHVHISSKVEWFEINDSLPQYRNVRE
ncbi:GFA family protein [Thalassotalea sp. PS06]|uniref:GFA family protein n=1 Tax=Thalassotalea sp. PS06 TaxID=2594005 RepID=UPI001C8F2A11|nr:GFA family protein [Thalassotalea sp. PS06]